MTRDGVNPGAHDLTPIMRLLTAGIGLDPRSVGHDTVARMIRLRIEETGSADAASYYQLVRRSPVELAALEEAAAVPETWFFRNEEAFRLLAETAWKRLLLRPTAPFRILSVPSSSGEEPYSAAMALVDRGVSPASFQIDAVDLRAGALEAAARATYGGASFRTEDLGFRDRHFRPEGTFFRLSEAITSQVHFLRGNLLDASLLSDQTPYDALLCRNLLIYFDEAARRRALSNIERLLLPTGLLLVGHAEALWLPRDRFDPVDRPGAFAARRREGAQRRPVPAQAATAASARAVAPRAEAGASPPTPSRRTSRRLQPVPPVPPPTDPLLVARQLADSGRASEAEASVRILLRAGEHTAGAYLLLGLLRQGAEDLAGAEDAFTRAVYLDPGDPEALACLALLRERRGDATGAQRLRDRARRAEPIRSRG